MTQVNQSKAKLKSTQLITFLKSNTLLKDGKFHNTTFKSLKDPTLYFGTQPNNILLSEYTLIHLNLLK